MSKYRVFLTPEEQVELDTIVGFQTYHRAKLREFRKSHLALIWKGRDRAKSAQQVKHDRA